MAQILEKQTSGNMYVDLELELEQIVLEEEQKINKTAEEKQKKIGKELSRLSNKAKHNANYLNETVRIENYKANIDKQIKYNHAIRF